MNKPISRKVNRTQTDQLRALFEGRGLALQRNPKNKYIAFEVRTTGRSIFTLYTSGKLVSTVREGDGEGLLIEDDIRGIAGDGPAVAGTSPAGSGAGSSGEGTSSARGPAAADAWNRPAGLRFLSGADETGTGELIGASILGAAWFPIELEADVAALVQHVETKSGRTNAGWERLGQQLLSLRPRGLVLAALPLPNRLFDHYSKNDLLDLAYVRLVGDMLGAAGCNPDVALDDAHFALDDYGTKSLIRDASTAWRTRGLTVDVVTKADVRFLAARTAAVFARAQRAREMQGLLAEVTDGPLGTGNAGHPQTVAWVKRRARSGKPWPPYVKTSFRTVTALMGEQPVVKQPLPRPIDVLDERSAADFLAGRLDVDRARLRLASGRFTRRLDVAPRGDRWPAEPALRLAPLLCGGLVLDTEALSLELLDEMLERNDGLLSGWRVLVEPAPDPHDPFTMALARAHARGVIHVVPTNHADPAERARAHAGLRVVTGTGVQGLRLHVRT